MITNIYKYTINTDGTVKDDTGNVIEPVDYFTRQNTYIYTTGNVPLKAKAFKVLDVEVKELEDTIEVFYTVEMDIKEEHETKYKKNVVDSSVAQFWKDSFDALEESEKLTDLIKGK